MDLSPPRSIVIIAHNQRSVHNVGAMLRTGEVFAVNRVYVTGFTPYPAHPGDERDAKLRDQLTRRMAKSAAGAQLTMPCTPYPDVGELVDSLREQDYVVAGLEIDTRAARLDGYRPSGRVALLVGDEVLGIDRSLRARCDVLLQIPMYGHKESLNVSVAAGIALYALRTG